MFDKLFKAVSKDLPSFSQMVNTIEDLFNQIEHSMEKTLKDEVIDELVKYLESLKG